MLTREINTRLIQKAIHLGKEVGNTPIVELRNLFSKRGVQLWAKQEWMQLSGSVKARAAYQIILNAIENRQLSEQKTLLDATSGNTGIAYATIGRKLGIRVALCIPENVSRERKEILESLGAEIIYTSRFEGTDGAQVLAREIATKSPEKYFYADQYRNNNNWMAHYKTTAEEIIAAQPHLTHFVAGLGTSGTFVGTGRKLKEYNRNIQLVSFQPDSALHGLEGWKHMGTALVPSIYDPSIADENIEVSTEEAYEMIKTVARRETLLLSPSSAANIVGALKVINNLDQGIVVTVLPDNASKYFELLQKLL